MALSSATQKRLNRNSKKKLMLLALFVSFLLTSRGSFGQVGAQLSELSGFKYWQWESFTSKLDKTFVVSSLDGTITRAVGDHSAMDNVFVQLKEIKRSTVIRTAQTNVDGRFHLTRVRPGKYMIKIAAPGFMTWIGIVIVPAKANNREALDVAMIPGS